MVLLRYVSDTALRENITRATDMVESYNNFSKWIGSGNNGVIAENDPEEQEKATKFNTLVADLVMYQTTLDMSLVLNQLRSEGDAVHRADATIMPPYQKDNVRSARLRLLGRGRAVPGSFVPSMFVGVEGGPAHEQGQRERRQPGQPGEHPGRTVRDGVQAG
jgi:hypothetical protein